MRFKLKNKFYFKGKIVNKIIKNIKFQRNFKNNFN